MPKVLYCHDNSDLAQTRKEILEKIHGHAVTTCTNARDSLERVQRGITGYDVAIVHKDLGLGVEPIGSNTVVAQIHESAPYVRVGIVSGEYPDGRNHVIEELQADFYVPVDDSEWYIKQVNRGPALPQEMERRGRSVEMPPN